MRVLIITYYWPPSGGGGVQRWLKLSKYLPEYGIRPLIYTPELRTYPHRDDSLIEEVQPGLEIWRLPIWEPQQYLGRLLGKQQPAALQQGFLPQPGISWKERLGIWVRANLFVPDPKVCWLWPSLRFLQKKLLQTPVDLVISTGPPHSMHLIGMALQRRMGLRWWADFRDCWTRWEMLLDLRPTGLAMAQQRRLERKVLRRCDRLLTVSKRWTDDFAAVGARSPMLLYNGYDEDDITSSTDEATPLDNKFRLLHLGNLNAKRTACFWAALRQLCLSDEAIADRLEIVLGGTLDNEVQQHIQQDALLSGRSRFVGYVPHKAVFKYYRSASVLLLFSHISPSMSGQVPGKLFEYFAMKRPILAVGDPEGEAASLVRTQDAGYCVDYKDTAAIAAALKAIFRREKSFNYANPAHFSRRHQASELAKEMKESKNR